MGKVETIQKPAALDGAQRRALVDEYSWLDEKLKPLVKRKEKLRAQILALHPDLADDLGVTESGDLYDLEIEPRGPERKVTALNKLAKYLGMKRFFALCKITVEAFEANVPAADRGPFLVEARTGGRRLIPTRKFTEAA